MIKKYGELEKASWKIQILVIFVNKNVGHIHSVSGRMLKAWHVHQSSSEVGIISPIL